ncbi:MAG: hypothetical protein ACLVIQ_02025 [Parabacteroides distasonis]
MDDIDISPQDSLLCKVTPNTHTYHVQDEPCRGIIEIMNETLKNGLVDGNVKRVDGMTLAAVDKFAITSPNVTDEAVKNTRVLHRFSIRMDRRKPIIRNWIPIVPPDIRDIEHAYSRWRPGCPERNIALTVVWSRRPVWMSIWKFAGPAKVFDSQDAACEGILGGKVVSGRCGGDHIRRTEGWSGMQEMLYPTSYIKAAI